MVFLCPIPNSWTFSGCHGLHWAFFVQSSIIWNRVTVSAHQILPTLLTLMLLHDHGDVTIRSHFRQIIQMNLAGSLSHCVQVILSLLRRSQQFPLVPLLVIITPSNQMFPKCQGPSCYFLGPQPHLVSWCPGLSMLHSHSKCTFSCHNEVITYEPKKGLSVGQSVITYPELYSNSKIYSGVLAISVAGGGEGGWLQSICCHSKHPLLGWMSIQSVSQRVRKANKVIREP